METSSVLHNFSHKNQIMEYIVGIDIGTGSTKAVALNSNLEPIGESQEHYPTYAPKPGYHEQDPELIWQAFTRCIDKMITLIGSSPQAIGISSAMHSLIPVDKNCIPLSRMTTWADSRSAHIATRIRQTEEGMAVYNATGTPIHGMSPLCKIIGLKEDQPDLFYHTYKFISIKEFVWFRLFNEFKIDHSIASCTGLFNIHTLTWHKEALKMAEITQEQLSLPVKTCYSKKGAEISADMLPSLRSTTFVIGANDGCLANLGSHANKPGVAALTIGTSGAVRITSTKPIFDNALMPFSYLLNEQTYVCGGPVNNGGIVLDWLLKSVLNKEDLSPSAYDQLFKGAGAIAQGSEGLIFLPYLSGERAPIWDAESSGAFIGLTLHHTQENIVRSVLEGICYALNNVLQGMELYSEKITQINVSGGFVHSRIWMEILADITGKKVILVQQGDASAIGAAYLVAQALNICTELVPSAASVMETIEANKQSHELHCKNFELFKQLYQDLMPAMHKLKKSNL